ARPTPHTPAPPAKPKEASLLDQVKTDASQDSELADFEDELIRLENRWRQIVDDAGTATALAKNLFIDSKPVSVEANRVTVGFDPQFAGKIEQAKITRNAEALKKALRSILRRTVDVSFTVLSANGTDKLPANSLDRHVESEKAEVPTDPMQQEMKLRKKCMEHKTVQDTLQVFNGNVIDIRK
ncbi:MAG: hypothetical protein GX811_00640, partial [Lentisphaerae bacterium]|nr:hypothetical protein [Lentisphaerota bacterium]